MTESRTVAAIDVGSNSVQITIARIDGPSVSVVARHKNPLRIRGSLGRQRLLPRRVIEQLVETLKGFIQLAEDHRAEIKASATASLRAARNRAELLEYLRDELGLNLHVISTVEEARLIRSGVIFGNPRYEDVEILCADVGGGSTELSVGVGPQIPIMSSTAVGSLVVHRQFLGPDPVSRTAVRRARKALFKWLEPHSVPFKHHPHQYAVATGGTIQRIARIACAIEGGDPNSIDGFFISSSVLDEIVSRIERLPMQSDRLRLPGMDPHRADILLGGALIFQVLGRLLKLKGWTVSLSALRTGLLIAPPGDYTSFD